MEARWTLGLLLVTALMAGCIGGDATDEPVLKNRAEVTGSSGGIQGVVTDPAVQPIEGATLTLVETSASTRTASDGSFAFSNVLPGVYTIRADAPEFISAQVEAVVRAGEVSVTDVILANLPSTLPYSQQIEFTGFVECSVATPVILFSVCSFVNSNLGSNVTNDHFTFPFVLDPAPWQIVAELSWQAGQPLASEITMLLENPDHFNDNGRLFGRETGLSPLILRVDRAKIHEMDANFTAVCEGEEEPVGSRSPDQYCLPSYAEEGGDLYTRLFVWFYGDAPTGLALQQRYDLIITTFHHAPACADYSMLLGNTCPQPELPAEEDLGEDAEAEEEEESG